MATRISGHPKTLSVEMAGSSHDDKILRWREERFLKMGWSVDDALSLAKTKIDLHMAEDLIDKGCSPVLTARILEGTSAFGEDR